MRWLLTTVLLLSALPALAQDVLSERAGTGDTNASAPAATLTPDPAARAVALGGIPAGGVLLVVESTNRRVMALSSQTGDVIDPNFVPANAANLTTPIEALIHSDGQRILVSDQVRDVVQSFDINTGAFLGTFAPAGGANTAILDNIRGIALRPNGNLLVSQSSGTVQEFSTSGVHIGPFIAAGSGGLDDSFDVFRVRQSAAPLVAGDFLVSDITLDDVLRYDANGAPLPPVVTTGIDFPEQVEQAANGNVLVAVFSGASVEGVVEFTPSGALVGRYDPATLGGYRGAFELGNGNILTTTGTGVHEISRANALVRTVVPGVSGRFIHPAGAGGGDLSITKVAQTAQVSPGGTGTFTLTASNAGPGAVSDVVVTDPLPSGLVFVSASCNGTVNAAGVFTWNVGTLAAGQSASCTLTVRPAFGGSFANVATISGTGDTTPGNNTSGVATLNGVVAQVPAGTVLGWLLLGLLFASAGWITLRR